MRKYGKLLITAATAGLFILVLAGCGGGDNASSGSGSGGIAPPPAGYKAVPSGPTDTDYSKGHSGPGAPKGK